LEGGSIPPASTKNIMDIPAAPEAEQPKIRLFNRDEYYKMAEVGILGPEDRVELLGGEIFIKHTDCETRRFTRDEYYKMAEVGILRPDERVELIEGEIVEMSPQNAPHAATLILAEEIVRGIFGDGYVVRIQMPLDIGEKSSPEPDILVVAGSARDQFKGHPKTGVLVIEITDSSSKSDITTKPGIYASVGIQEYWVVLVQDRKIIVHRSPASGTGGGQYADITVVEPGDQISALGNPTKLISVSDFFV
jgi:Uma2 family endonuclease